MVPLLGVALSFLLASAPPSSVARMVRNSIAGSAPSATSQRRSARITAQTNGAFGSGSGDASGAAMKRRIGVPAQRMAKASVGDKNMPPLLNLGKLMRGTLVKRPSSTVRSPYVADVSLNKETVLAHAPALDVGGMCVSGSEVYLSRRDGDGKTSHSIELVRGAPLAKNSASKSFDDVGVLVGAHPRLGELIAEEVLKRGLLREAITLRDGFELGSVNHIEEKKSSPKKEGKKRKAENDDNSPTAKISLRRQVTLGDSRVDFEITLSGQQLTSHRVIFEVKNVVCADFEEGTEPTKTGPNHCVVVAPSSSSGGYKRTALFPWGSKRGQTFEGKKVVSERACKHLKNLQSLRSEDVTTVVLFVVNRSDCGSVRACHEQCPVFAEVLNEVVKTGVKALAVRVKWSEDGVCHFDGAVPVDCAGPSIEG